MWAARQATKPPESEAQQEQEEQETQEQPESDQPAVHVDPVPVPVTLPESDSRPTQPAAAQPTTTQPLTPHLTAQEPATESTQNNDTPGGGFLGDGGLQAGKGNMRMIQRAIKERWPISDTIRQQLIGQMAQIVSRSGNQRDIIAAAKVLVSADLVNLKDKQIELSQQPKSPGKVQLLNVTNNVGIGMVSGPAPVQEEVTNNNIAASLRHQILNDSTYLEFLRQSGMGPAATEPARLESVGVGTGEHAAATGSQSGN